MGCNPGGAFQQRATRRDDISKKRKPAAGIRLSVVFRRWNLVRLTCHMHFACRKNADNRGDVSRRNCNRATWSELRRRCRAAVNPDDLRRAARRDFPMPSLVGPSRPEAPAPKPPPQSPRRKAAAPKNKTGARRLRFWAMPQPQAARQGAALISLQLQHQRHTSAFSGLSPRTPSRPRSDPAHCCCLPGSPRRPAACACRAACAGCRTA